MRFEHSGMQLWYDEADAPAPQGTVEAGTEVPVTVGIQPEDTSNRIEVLYRVNGGPAQSMVAKWLRNDSSRNVQYFQARLPAFEAGDTVEYTPICHCAGRQVPSPDEAQEYTSSFRAVGAGTELARESVLPTARHFEESHGSGTVGVVGDGRAAEPINAALNTPTPNLQGRDLSIGMQGDDVWLLQSKLRQLGFDIPDHELQEASFGQGTRDAVVRFQEELRLEPTGVVDAETSKAINQAVDASIYTVAGTVASPDRAGVGGLRVEIVDKNVGDDVLLTEAVSDELGHYEARFAARSLRERGKTQPDLQARVYVGDVFLAASDIRYNAAISETLDVKLPPNSAALPSEHETLTGALAAHYDGQLNELQESDDRQDVTYLANKTGWDARAVALAALSTQFSRDSADGGGAIDPAFYYALFRAGLPANPDTLYQADAQTVERVWKQAIEQGVIPKAIEEELPKAVEAFQNLSATHSLDARTLPGTSTLREMLQLRFGNDVERQQRFANLYAREGDDLPAFWVDVEKSFGEETAKSLQLDGQLGYLTLNNAPLIKSLHDAEEQNPLVSSLDLAQRGYYRAEKWHRLVDGDVPEPVPGETPEEKRANYAELLAAQVRLSFPTTVVAEMVRSEENPLNVPDLVRDDVHAFLTNNQGGFEIGMQPVEQYIARNGLRDQVRPETTKQIKRLQRVYQITTTDSAMSALLSHDLDSAYHIVRYDEAEFVQTFKDELGGEEVARLTYAKSQLVHNAVLNIASGYLNARTAPALGSDANALIINPHPNDQAPETDNASDIVAYPTLERLFGEMDYCACEHCRSILSPAAYLVDLLHSIDRPVNDKENPQTVLLERRPDIQHLQLTCENTNTPLPYIDVVNEMLEYFIVSKPAAPPMAEKPSLSLANYEGYNTDDSATAEELLANPRFVNDAAYDILKREPFPPPLPFHRALESLRRYFDKFGVPLQEAMEALRANDAVEQTNPAPYGWRDILMEQLKLSRAEYALLTDIKNLTLGQLYGYASTVPDADVLAGLSNVKAFARRVRIQYEDVIELLRTKFINPNSTLIPRLERLRVPFSTLEKLKDENISDTAFDALLPAGLDPAEYGGDIKAWVKNDANYARIMGLVTVANPANSADLCSFDELEFRYANPNSSANALHKIDYVCLLRFIRLWKKLGWTIEQTDKAITALYPADQLPTGADEDDDLQRLDTGFLKLLPRLGVALRVMELLKLTPKKDLPGLLACWAPIDTHGANSLYRTMFGSPALLEQDPAFADDGYGNVLQGIDVPYTHPQAILEQAILDAAPGGIGYDHLRERLSYTGVLSPEIRDALKAVSGVSAEFQEAVDTLYHTQRLLAHTETLRAAFGLTGEELSLIVDALGYDADTPLTLENISEVYRRGWLARKLRLSVSEFLLLSRYTGLDPFAAPDPANPPVARFLQFVEALRTASLKPVEALYLIWNQDISGESAPDEEQITALARMLRAGCTEVESLFTVADDPAGEIARSRMALVYGVDATDFFFGLLDNTLSVDVPYSHPQPTLEKEVLEVATGRIGYDDFRKRLTYTGVLNTTTRDKLQAVAGVSTQFQGAVNRLYDANQAVIGPFFARFPELLPIHEAYTFFGQLGVSADYAHDQTTLEQAILDVAPNRLAYDDVRKRLSYAGVLTTTTRDALKGVSGVSAEFQEAVDDLYAANQAAIEGFFTRYPELASQREAYVAANDSEEQRRSVLLANFLPELKKRRKRQQALAAAGAAASTDDAFARTVLEDAAVLRAAGDNAKPTLDDLTALETPGLSVQFFWRDTATGNADSTADTVPTLAYAAAGPNKLPANPAGGDPISGIWSGYLEAPENGLYKVAIETDAGASVSLTLDGESVELADNDNIWSNQEQISLNAGTLYPLVLKVEKVKNSLAVRWETTGRGWETIPARYLYSATLVDHLRTSYIRFLKASSLATALKLTANETAHFAAHADYKIDERGWLNALPVSGGPKDDATSRALRDVLAALLDFARIKAALSADDERLVSVLREPDATLPNGQSALTSLTRWESGSLNALLARFGKNQADLAHLDTFRRVHDGYTLVTTFGISASALLASATNEPDADTVRDLQSALRARYDEADWLEALKPINDEMRDLQRDALVAYVLQKLAEKSATNHIDTPEKLFEYFLMDVQMEPCMQTSRIRHALSSVQLFIERCLMNLERQVAPSSIKADQWEWMKRYRVWEANRKVFLWPENWLEPELRDDQSPFFKEAMGELLQSDITEDTAATALLNYLSKLDEVAKLEPCGIHYVENDPGTEDDVAHVVARTAGAHRKYYYRRREPSGWTPWEQIKLEVEDNPVLPVVWKGRLFLIWLKILKQAPLTVQKPGTRDVELTSLKTSDIESESVKVPVRAVLCWSEYYNGKWQPTRTSDVERPTSLGTYQPSGPNAFDRSESWLQAVEGDDLLQIETFGDDESSFFVLYNAHSLPVRSEDVPDDFSGIYLTKARYVHMSGETLYITYIDPTTSSWRTHSVLKDKRPVMKNQVGSRIVAPYYALQSDLNSPYVFQNDLNAPFFYSDGRHVFHVRTSTQSVKIPEVSSFGIVKASPTGANIAPLVAEEFLPFDVTPETDGAIFNGRNPGAVDPSPVERFVTEDVNIRMGIGTTAPVRYGDREIGPAGTLSDRQMR